ncbi:MAG: hypothetical protein WA005_17625 [Candidatus Binataceae bacterium]
MSDERSLRLVGVEPRQAIAGARRLVLRTSRGAIPMVLHAASSSGPPAAPVSI